MGADEAINIEDELVHYAEAGGVATITLDSPKNRNALSARLRRELAAALAKARGEDTVRVIVLTHTGPVFCAGMDLKEPPAERDNSEFPLILDQLWNCPKPVVAKLAGSARAGGIGMIAAADIAVAVRSATFAFSEVRIGVVPALISLTVLPRISPRAAQELLLTGEVFDAQRAADIDLINSAVAPEHLDETVAAHVDSLLRGGPQALAATKELLRNPAPPNFTAGLTAMSSLSAHYFATPEAQEGRQAFTENRPPTWHPAP